MEPQTIIDVVAQRGGVLTLRGDVLNVAPISVLDDELRGAIRASKRELLALLAEPLVEREVWQPQAEALEPPEAAPSHPSWRTPATWNTTHGFWERCGGIVPTEATRENIRRHREAKRAQASEPLPVEATPQALAPGRPGPALPASPERLRRANELGAILHAFPGQARLLTSGLWKIRGQRYTHAQALALAQGGEATSTCSADSLTPHLTAARSTLEASARAAGQRLPDEAEVRELAEALLAAAQEEAVWRADGGARQAPDDLDVGAAFRLEAERLPDSGADGALDEALAWERELLGAGADAAEVRQVAEATLEARRAAAQRQPVEVAPST